MSDALSAIIADETDATAAATVFVEDDAPESQALEWAALVAACSPSETHSVSRLTSWSVTETPGWDGYPIGVAALLTFIADGAPFDVLIPSPSFPCFLGDGTVDESYTPIANLIAWVIANGRSPAGSAVDSYDDGRRVTLAPGLAAVYGAAAVIGSGSAIGASFHAVPDGGDITGG